MVVWSELPGSGSKKVTCSSEDGNETSGLINLKPIVFNGNSF
jgi:hypothetical protein